MKVCVNFQSLKMAFPSGGIVTHASSTNAMSESVSVTEESEIKNNLTGSEYLNFSIQFINTITSNYVCILTFMQ